MDKQAEHPLVHDYSFHSTQVDTAFSESTAPNEETSTADVQQRTASESVEDSETEVVSESEEKFSISVGSIAETVVNNSIAGAIVSQCITSAHEIVQTEAHINK